MSGTGGRRRAGSWLASLVFLLLVLAALSPVPSAAASPAELAELAGRARLRLAQPLSPDPEDVDDIWVRFMERSLLERRWIGMRQAAALQALLEMVPGQATELELRDALEQLAHGVGCAKADTLLARRAGLLERAGGAVVTPAVRALAWRQTVALCELPDALVRAMRPAAGPVTSLGRTGLVSGALARPTLERVAEWQPLDASTRVELLWLALAQAVPGAGAPGVDASVAAQHAWDAVRMDGAPPLALVSAAPALARVWQRTGAPAEAEVALLSALSSLERMAGEQPADAGPMLAFMRHRLAELLATRGRATEAWGVYERVLAQREQLVAQAPQDRERQWALIATHQAMDLLASRTPQAPDAWKGHGPKAAALYARLRETRPLQAPMGADVARGMATFLLPLCFLLAALLAAALLALYRWRVGRWMQVVAMHRRPEPAFPPVGPGVAGHPRGAGTVQLVDDAGPFDPAWAQIAECCQRRAVWIEVAAGAAFGVVGAALERAVYGYPLHPVAHLLNAWGWALPLLLTMPIVRGAPFSLLARPQAWIVAAFALVLAAVLINAGLGDRPPITVPSTVFVPIQLSTLAAVWPDLFPAWLKWHPVQLSSLAQVATLAGHKLAALGPLLLLLARPVRAVAMTVLLMVTVCGVGGVLTTVLSATWWGQSLLARLPAVAATTAVGQALAVFLLGFALAMPLAWGVARGLGAAARGGWLRRQDLAIDAAWWFQAVLLCSALAQDAGWIGLVGFGPLLAYKALYGLLSRGVLQRTSARPARRLLLLRVFDTGGRSERLFEALMARWRHVGPLHFIGAPDLAASTIDSERFAAFIGGRLRRLFVVEPQDLPARLAALDLGPDARGTYAVNELFCGNDTWQDAVQQLMQRSDLCLMDLRGFDTRRQGCQIELGALLLHMPAPAIVLLVDTSTDMTLLEACLRRHHAGLPPSGPNAGREIALTLLRDRGRVSTVVDALLAGAGTK